MKKLRADVSKPAKTSCVGRNMMKGTSRTPLALSPLAFTLIAMALVSMAGA